MNILFDFSMLIFYYPRQW